MANVKIALRVRPLHEKELQEEKSSKMVVVAEDDHTVAITNLKVPASNAGDSRERVKRFSFDFCFDSSTPASENYATQELVYEKLGAIVLESLARGQDACVLAYGQSSSGKTHTMQGTASQPGLAPRLCEALMLTSDGEIAQATVSYFEIYNERVRDLLTSDDLQTIDEGRPSSVAASVQNRNTKDLRVREHPKKGPYVEGLRGVEVQTSRQLSGVVALGASRRRTAATAGNATSSRSHSLLSIQKLNATLTLLDLAGSERPSRVNQSLPRQKEGSSINKSLVALANVISALAYAGPRVVSRYVPYRDSILTWLLKDTLAGRTTTVMIATVSPSCCCYSETVNTMRWAARASRIPASSNVNPGPGTSRVNDSPHEKAIRLLRAEVTRLRELLREATISKSQTLLPVKIKHPKTPAVEDPDSSQTYEIKSEVDEGCEISEVSDSTIKEEKEIGEQNRETEAGDSLNSLASSRISINSNDTLSGNNSIPSTQGSNLNSSQAEDVLFGPRLHRAGSVHDVKPLPPLRNKKRQYRSHEVLPSLDKYTSSKNAAKLGSNGKKSSNSNGKSVQSKDLKENSADLNDKDNDPTLTIGSKSNNALDSNKPKTHVPYEPFNKRANIVASVTDRLYSISKKDEFQLLNKPEPISIERRNSQSLSELRICSNARKRLYDFSHRALKMSRRLRIGIAVETQTDKQSAVRVKEVAIDTQHDIEPIQNHMSQNEKQFRNASIGTEKSTLLCKEASVGTIGGSIRSNDKSVETDKINEAPSITITRTCGNMTENLTSSLSTSTQTSEPIPPRKKFSSFTKYLKVSHDPTETVKTCERSSPRVLNISISHDCGPFENETDGISDDSLEGENKVPNKTSERITAPPDLLNNHNSTENLAHGDPCCSHSPQPKFSLSNDSYSIEKRSKSLNKNLAAERDNGVMGGSLPSIDENKFTSECRDNAKLTKADGAIESETVYDINQRCDRVSTEPGEVIKDPVVTGSILQPAILKTDTEHPSANNGTGGQNRENASRESKSIQVGLPRDSYAVYGDFLDDVYIPLPRICIDSDYRTDRWPEMRNLIMGRNDNMYPYNIKTSPRKDISMEKRKLSKSVTWKSSDDETSSSTVHGKSIMKKAISSPAIQFASKPSQFIEKSHSTSQSSGSEFQLDSDEASADYIKENTRLSGINPMFDHFKGIHCWNERSSSPVRKRENKFSKYRHDSDACRSDTKRCLQYVEATSNFLVEATNLVTALNKTTSKFNEADDGVRRTISPICNDRLQIVDENKNSYRSFDFSDRNTRKPVDCMVGRITPSKSIETKFSDAKHSHVINDSLIDIDECNKDMNNGNDSSSGPTSIFNDPIFLKNSDRLDNAEENLLSSLNRLEDCTKRTSEYFNTMKGRYKKQFNADHHHSLPINLNDGIPSPFPRHRRSPSRYLQQLLELRKELVQSTKRDDDIFKHFQVR